jgi:hypothetical protein
VNYNPDFHTKSWKIGLNKMDNLNNPFSRGILEVADSEPKLPRTNS